jgi:hypothetical protein
MDNSPVFLIEFGLFGFVAVGFGVWQVWSVRRLLRKPPSKEPPRHTEG